MQLRILGCSGGFGKGLRTTSYLLDERILVDAGTGVGDLSQNEMCGVRDVFLTHSHLDHCTGLPLLIDTVFSCREEPLRVHSTPVTIQALKDHLFNWVIWPDFAELPTADAPVMTYRTMEPGDAFELDGYTFEMIPVNHTVPGVAYVISREDKTFCFTGDTCANDTLWKGLNARENLDLLLVECGFPNEREELAQLAKHYVPKTLAADLKKLEHRPRVCITHLEAGQEERTFAECKEAIEGFDLHRVRHGEILDV